MNKEVDVRQAKDRGDEHCDQTNATNIDRREEVRQELWSAHFKSPTFALSEALRRVVEDDADSSSACGEQHVSWRWFVFLHCARRAAAALSRLVVTQAAAPSLDTPAVAAIKLSPIKNLLQLWRLECDGSLVQAPSDGAIMFAWNLACSSHLALISESL